MKTHVHMIVSNVSATVDYYTKSLGAKFLNTGTDAQGAIVHGEVELCGQRIVFSGDRGRPGSDDLPWRARARTAQGPRGAGFAFVLTLEQEEDIDDLFRRLAQDGARIVLAPQETSWGSKIAGVEAPDGYLIQYEKFARR